jgi:hypothetical protein
LLFDAILQLIGELRPSALVKLLIPVQLKKTVERVLHEHDGLVLKLVTILRSASL